MVCQVTFICQLSLVSLLTGVVSVHGEKQRSPSSQLSAHNPNPAVLTHILRQLCDKYTNEDQVPIKYIMPH